MILSGENEGYLFGIIRALARSWSQDRLHQQTITAVRDQIGLFGPTDDEIRASVENSKLTPCVVPKGVYRYRAHTEANVAADRWVVESMVKRALELRDARCK